MADLSWDARVVLKSWFGFGPKTSVSVGGIDAQSVLTERGLAAIEELINAGFVTVEPVGCGGRMKYTGTGKPQPRMTMADMERHGRWSATGPNPRIAALTSETSR